MASLKYNSKLLSSFHTCSVLLSDTTQNCYLLITLALFPSEIQLRTVIFWSYLLCSPLRYNSELLSSDHTCSLPLWDTTQNCCLMTPLALFSSQIQLRTAVFWPHLLCSPLRYNSELLSSGPTCSALLSDTTQNCCLLTPLALFSSQIQLRTAVFWSYLGCSLPLWVTTQNCSLLIILSLFSSQIQLRTAVFWSYLLCSPLRYNSELLSSDPTCSVLLSDTTQNCCLLVLLALFSSVWFVFFFFFFLSFWYKITNFAISTAI